MLIEIINEPFETEKEIRGFATPDYFCFYDDYRCPLQHEEIEYPSVRHAVISLKTNDAAIKKEIASIMLAADLKTYERQLPFSSYWSRVVIINALTNFTIQKFKENPTYAKNLSETSPKILRNDLLKGQGRYDILDTERRDYYGEILMKVRDTLKK